MTRRSARTRSVAARSMPIPMTPSGAVATISPIVTSSMIRLRRLIPATVPWQPRGPGDGLLHDEGPLHARFVVPLDVAADLERTFLRRREQHRGAFALLQFDLEIAGARDRALVADDHFNLTHVLRSRCCPSRTRPSRRVWPSAARRP